MIVTMVNVQSLDGKLTHGDNPDVHSWSSDEDARNFEALKANANLIVMGRKTYELMAPYLMPKAGRLRIVVTSQPEQFAAKVVPGELEFTSEQPAELVERLNEVGYEHMMLVGGGMLNGSFLAASQVDELYETIEPRIFGDGKSLAGVTVLDVAMTLLSAKRLNDKGTLLLHYAVDKNA